MSPLDIKYSEFFGGSSRHFLLRASISHIVDTHVSGALYHDTAAIARIKAAAANKITQHFYGDVRQDVRQLELLLAQRFPHPEDPALVLIKKIQNQLW